jgi:hypothetical protein
MDGIPTFFNKQAVYDPTGKYTLDAEDLYRIRMQKLSEKDRRVNDGVYVDLYNPNEIIGRKMKNISEYPNLYYNNDSTKYFSRDKIPTGVTRTFGKKCIPKNIDINKNYNPINYRNGDSINKSRNFYEQSLLDEKKNKYIFYAIIILIFCQFITFIFLFINYKNDGNLLEKLLLLKYSNEK